MFKNIIYSPILSLILLVLSSSFFLTFIAVKLSMDGEAENIAGYIHSAFYGGMLIGAIKTEEIINRVGHIRGFPCFASLITITIILQALYPQALLWILFRFFSGLALAGSYVIIESWLLEQSDTKTKGKILAIYMCSLYLSQSINQFLLDIVDLNTLEPFLLAAILASVAVIPACLTYMQAPEIEIAEKISIFKYYKISPFGFIGCIISGLILSAIYSFLPNYAQDNNISVSMMLGITIGGGFILQWPIGKLSDMFDRSRVLISISFLTSLVALMFMLVSNYILIYIISFFLGGLCFTIYPVSIAQVCDHLKSGNIVNMTGALLCSYGIGAVLGPLIISNIISHSSTSGIFIYICSMGIILTGFGIYELKKEKPVPLEEQVDFVAMPRATPVANQLDPRI